MLHIHSFLHRRRHVILAVDSVVKQQALAAVSDMRNKQW
jgi:hypothetical protein